MLLLSLNQLTDLRYRKSLRPFSNSECSSGSGKSRAPFSTEFSMYSACSTNALASLNLSSSSAFKVSALFFFLWWDPCLFHRLVKHFM